LYPVSYGEDAAIKMPDKKQKMHRQGDLETRKKKGQEIGKNGPEVGRRELSRV
jgi:hypothetical protein